MSPEAILPIDERLMELPFMLPMFVFLARVPIKSAPLAIVEPNKNAVNKSFACIKSLLGIFLRI
jgi:hypothetical protein